MKNVIFGGTFDPVHNSHIEMVEAVNALDDVEKIIIIPANIPPHKNKSQYGANAEDRLNMCKIAFESFSKAVVSDYEIKRQDISYTVETVKYFSNLENLCLLIGGDMLVTFDGWYCYKEILKRVEILAVMRPGIDKESFFAAKKQLEKDGGKITVVDVSTDDISSTVVRSELENNRKTDLIPENVLNYISKNDLYCGKTYDFEQLKLLIKGKLSEYRYIHCLNVAKEAERLARIYGANPVKAKVAGLLHDATKDFTEKEQLQLFSKFSIILSDVELVSGKLWHAMSGEVYVKNILGVDDGEILSAIRYHTTAKANMSLLEKIIYIADFTSADRNYKDVDDIRKSANFDLNSTMEMTLKFTINDLTAKGCVVHPDTIDAYNDILNKKEEFNGTH